MSWLCSRQFGFRRTAKDQPDDISERTSERSSRISTSLKVDSYLPPTPRSSTRGSSRKESVLQDDEVAPGPGPDFVARPGLMGAHLSSKSKASEPPVSAQASDPVAKPSGRMSPRKAAFLDEEEVIMVPAHNRLSDAAETVMFSAMLSPVSDPSPTASGGSPPSGSPLSSPPPQGFGGASLVNTVPSPPQEPRGDNPRDDRTFVQALQAGKRVVCFDPRLEKFADRWLKVDLRRTFLYILESNADVQGSVRALQAEHPCIVRLDHIKCVHAGHEASELLDENGVERTEARFAAHSAVVLHHLEPKSFGEPEVVFRGCRNTPELKMLAFLEAPGDRLEAHITACLRHLPNSTLVCHNAATKLQHTWRAKEQQHFPRLYSSTLKDPAMLFSAAARSLDLDLVFKSEVEGTEDVLDSVSIPAAMELGSGRGVAWMLDSVLGRDYGPVDRATIALHMEELGAIREICLDLAEGTKCDLAKFLLYGSKEELAKAILRPTQEPELAAVAEKTKLSQARAKAQPLKRVFLSAVGHRFAQEERLGKVAARLRALGRLPGGGRSSPRSPRPTEPVGIVSPTSDAATADLVKRLEAPVRGRRLRSVQFLDSRAPTWVAAADGIIQLLTSAGVQQGQVVAIDAHGDPDGALFSAHFCLELPDRGPLRLRYKREEPEEGFSWPGLYEKVVQQLQSASVLSITGSTSTSRGKGGTLFAFYSPDPSLAGISVSAVESRATTRQLAADRLLRMMDDAGVEAGQLLWVDLHQQPNTDDVCLSACFCKSLPSLGRRRLRVDESPPRLGWAALYAWAAARIEALALSQEDVISVTYSRDRAERCMGLMFYWVPEPVYTPQSVRPRSPGNMLQARETEAPRPQPPKPHAPKPQQQPFRPKAQPKAHSQPLGSLRGLESVPAAKPAAGASWHWAWEDRDGGGSQGASPERVVEKVDAAALQAPPTSQPPPQVAARHGDFMAAALQGPPTSQPPPQVAARHGDSMAKPPPLLPLQALAEPDDFVVMSGKVIFRSSDAAHDMPAADLDACKRLCKQKRYGAFTVTNERAYFRREAPEECVRYMRDDPTSTTYVLRPLAKRPKQLHVMAPDDGVVVEYLPDTAAIDRACACKMQ